MHFSWILACALFWVLGTAVAEEPTSKVRTPITSRELDTSIVKKLGRLSPEEGIQLLADNQIRLLDLRSGERPKVISGDIGAEEFAFILKVTLERKNSSRGIVHALAIRKGFALDNEKVFCKQNTVILVSGEPSANLLMHEWLHLQFESLPKIKVADYIFPTEAELTRAKVALVTYLRTQGEKHPGGDVPTPLALRIFSYESSLRGIQRLAVAIEEMEVHLMLYKYHWDGRRDRNDVIAGLEHFIETVAFLKEQIDEYDLSKIDPRDVTPETKKNVQALKSLLRCTRVVGLRLQQETRALLSDKEWAAFSSFGVMARFTQSLESLSE